MRRSSGENAVDVVLDVGGDDRVVVGDLRVVDDPAERQLLRARGRSARASAYSGIGWSVAAVGFSCGTRSPER